MPTINLQMVGCMTQVYIFQRIVHSSEWCVEKFCTRKAVGVTSKSLMAWVIGTNGQIYSAHYDCKARLAEVCTHVATLLVGIDAGVRICGK